MFEQFEKRKKWNFTNEIAKKLEKYNWKKSKEDGGDLVAFETTILVDYDMKVLAYIAIDKEGIQLDGTLGIHWLEVSYAEEKNKPSYFGHEDLEAMLYAIHVSELDLLKLGFPFVPSYHYVDKDIKYKQLLNSQNRTDWGVDSLEKEWGYGER